MFILHLYCYFVPAMPWLLLFTCQKSASGAWSFRQGQCPRLPCSSPNIDILNQTWKLEDFFQQVYLAFLHHTIFTRLQFTYLIIALLIHFWYFHSRLRDFLFNKRETRSEVLSCLVALYNIYYCSFHSRLTVSNRDWFYLALLHQTREYWNLSIRYFIWLHRIRFCLWPISNVS